MSWGSRDRSRMTIHLSQMPSPIKLALIDTDVSNFLDSALALERGRDELGLGVSNALITFFR